MPALQILTASEQVTAHLRRELLQGTWSGTMPGEQRLVAELGVSPSTVKAALRELEREGLLLPQGAGRRRLIRIPNNVKRESKLRVAIMLYEPADKECILTLKLCALITESGFLFQFAPKSLMELKMDPQRVARSIRSIQVDAWIVNSASDEVLKYFSSLPTPVMACGGRSRPYRIAATAVSTAPTLVELVRKLHTLGHRRIVTISEKVCRIPKPGLPEQSILDEMERFGIKTGSYNLPDWDDTPEGLRACLDSLYCATPPHALIMGTPQLFIYARDHLLQRGIHAPRDVSMISVGDAAGFESLQPAVSRIAYDLEAMPRAMLRWLRNLQRGKPNQRRKIIKACLIEGATIGPAPA